MVTIKCCKCGHEQTEEIYTIGDEWSLSMTICEACNTDLVFNDAGHTMFITNHEPISVAVDIICYKSNDEILLIKRANNPEIGKWALPGGFVEAHETCTQAAARELYEETGVAVNEHELTLIGVLSKPNRDQRGRVISVLYAIEVPTNTQIRANDDAIDVKFVDLMIGYSTNLHSLAFDHAKMVMMWYVTR